MKTVLKVRGLWLATLLGLAGGCGIPTSILNPELFDALQLGGAVATVPGDAPALRVNVDNRTGRVIETRITWRDADNKVGERVYVLNPATQRSEAVICTVEELTFGDISNLSAAGAVVRLGTGSAEDPIVEVEAFGTLLRDQVNYVCGDEVTFAVGLSSSTASGYQVIAYIRRSGTSTE